MISRFVIRAPSQWKASISPAPVTPGKKYCSPREPDDLVWEGRADDDEVIDLKITLLTFTSISPATTPSRSSSIFDENVPIVRNRLGRPVAVEVPQLSRVRLLVGRADLQVRGRSSRSSYRAVLVHRRRYRDAPKASAIVRSHQGQQVCAAGDDLEICCRRPGIAPPRRRSYARRPQRADARARGRRVTGSSVVAPGAGVAGGVGERAASPGHGRTATTHPIPRKKSILPSSTKASGKRTKHESRPNAME